MLEAILIGFFIILLMVSIRRSISRINEMQNRQQPLRVDDILRRPSDEYHDNTWLPLCESTAVSAEARMLRFLTSNERRSIWRARSELALQVLQQELQTAETPEQMTVLILQLPTGIDRPDPTGWCDATKTM